MNTYTSITPHKFVCNDCGAHADSPSQVEHYPTCEPGCSKFWEEHYNPEEKEVQLAKIEIAVRDSDGGLVQSHAVDVDSLDVALSMYDQLESLLDVDFLAELVEEAKDDGTYYTLEPCGDEWRVYEHGEYGHGSVLEGSPRRALKGMFPSIEEAQRVCESMGIEPQITEGSTRVEHTMSDCPPSDFSPLDAGEEW